MVTQLAILAYTRLGMLASVALGHLRRDRGQAAPEYVMIIGFISLVIVLAFIVLQGPILLMAQEVKRVVECWGNTTPTTQCP